ncbi:MAG: FkbM family methyltransferase [Pseudomonadota bacterium]|nr:FkbM family methyltransferase [Pseudomonadota bacterium]
MKSSPFLVEFRSWLFVTIARLSAHLPAFRGRTRAFLLLYTLLGLNGHKLVVETQLRRPIRFSARLDIQSWLQRVAFLTGEYEGNTVTFLHRVWQGRGGRGYLLDVGANVGMISVPFALIARDSMQRRPVVIAVEAVPDNAAALTTNIALNRLEDSVQVIGTALGDEEKSIRIQVEGDLAAGEGSGTANILPDGSTYGCVAQTLRLLTLDGLLAAGKIGPDCTVIKIDTDGYDLKVVQGGAALLASGRPIVYGEFSAHCMQWHHQTIDDVRRFAEKLNYALLFRQDSRMRFSDLPPVAGYSQDVLLVPNELKSELAWCCESITVTPQSEAEAGDAG